VEVSRGAGDVTSVAVKNPAGVAGSFVYYACA